MTGVTAGNEDSMAVGADQMNVDSEPAPRVARARLGCIDGKPISTMPYYGTIDSNKFYEPEVKCSQTLQELYEEFKYYRKLRKQDELNSNQPVGTSAYLVSMNWLKIYEEFLLYEQFNNGVPESQLKCSDNHF